MDDALDLDAVRLLSAWLSARRDLSAHLDLLTAFGPSAAEQLARNLRLVDELHGKDHSTWLAYRNHVLRRSTDALGE
ncbi:MAG TPA: hypothetical protein VFR07_04310 [Mycobacteriales bacterium]|jgi:hypothetical protein|nr:hypothetical protein [Mycobacteriales bacterium]